MLKFTDDFENNEKLILRDHLALERTKLANERTLFSYIRTSLYLLTAGTEFSRLKIFRDSTVLHGYVSFRYIHIYFRICPFYANEKTSEKLYKNIFQIAGFK